MVTLDQIATELGISKSAVSYVLAGKADEKRISRQMADRIRRVATRLNYVPNRAARSLLQGKTRVVGIVLRNAADRPLHNPANMEVVLGASQSLEGAGYVVCLVRIDDLRNDAAPSSRIFHERMVDGLMVLDDMPPGIDERIDQLSPDCVRVHTSMFGPQRHVREDEIAAGRAIGEAAVRNGYRRFVWAGPPQRETSHYSVRDRHAGLAEIARKHRIPCENLAHFYEGPSEKYLSQLHDCANPKTAFVTYSADEAMRLTISAGRLRLIAGEDFGLAACDDWEPTRRTWPELTRVSRDLLGMGQIAAQMLLRIIDDPQADCPSVLWPGTWISGATLNGPPTK